MPRATKPSFVTELPLKVDSAQDRELQTRLLAARQLYNGCLGEAMTRLKLVRNSTAYQRAAQILRRYVNQDELSVGDARSEYPRLEQVLVEAWKDYQKAAKKVSESGGGASPAPLNIGCLNPRSGSLQS